MLSVAIRQSTTVARIVGAKRKECWKNAALGTIVLAEGPGTYYVEGWVVLPVAGGLAIEHGWIVTGEPGHIVDPTLAADDWLEDIVYFESKRFYPHEIQPELELPILNFRDWEHRLGYKSAQDYIAEVTPENDETEHFTETD
jgi:hypothetical protein